MLKKNIILILICFFCETSYANLFEDILNIGEGIVNEVTNLPEKILSTSQKPTLETPNKLTREKLNQITQFSITDADWVHQELVRLLSSNELRAEQYDWIYDFYLLNQNFMNKLEIGSPARKNLFRFKIDQLEGKPPYLIEMSLSPWGYNSLDKAKEKELGIKNRSIKKVEEEAPVTIRIREQKKEAPIKTNEREEKKSTGSEKPLTQHKKSPNEKVDGNQIQIKENLIIGSTVLFLLLFITYVIKNKRLNSRLKSLEIKFSTTLNQQVSELGNAINILQGNESFADDSNNWSELISLLHAAIKSKEDEIQRDKANVLKEIIKDLGEVIGSIQGYSYYVKENDNWNDLILRLNSLVSSRNEEINSMSSEILKLEGTIAEQSDQLSSLEKYEGILNIEKEIESLKQQADLILLNAEEAAKSIEDAARSSSKELETKARENFESAIARANQMTEAAEKRAEEIAGDAFEAKKNVDFYKSALESIKHEIDGVGSEFIVPNKSVLDDLAEEYDHKKAGQDLAQARKASKLLVKTDKAADCDYVERNRRETAIRFVIDAYNGKVDSLLSRLKHDNYGQLKQKIEDARHIVQLNGEAFRNARITDQYHNARLEELRLGVATAEL